MAARYIFNNADLIFVEGNNGKKDIEGVAQVRNKIRRFTHWCDQEKFRPGYRRPGRVRVLFIGRDIPDKGIDAIKGAESFLDKEKYKFTYVTKAKYSDLPEIYRHHHILCVPSLYDEGFSRVVIEGASSGCAVITSDWGSLPEQVRDFGRICSWPYVITFRHAIESIDYEDMGNKAFEYARKNFTKSNAEVFLNAYRN